MTNYSRGANFERSVRDYFDKQGFFCLRSAGSRSLVDLVAVSPEGKVCFIQCKCGRSPLSYEDGQKLCELARTFRATPILATPCNATLRLCKDSSSSFSLMNLLTHQPYTFEPPAINIR